MITLFKGLGLAVLRQLLQTSPIPPEQVTFRAHVPAPTAKYTCHRCHDRSIINPNHCTVRPSDPDLPIYFEACVRCPHCQQSARVQFLPSGSVIGYRPVESRRAPTLQAA